jgi:sulfur-carrier protein
MRLNGKPMSAHRPEVTLRYFAWVREKAGVSEESVMLPEGVQTVADLVRWQSQRGEGFAAAFQNSGVVRVAVDQTHAKADTPIGNAREIGFFPPVTGG